MERWIAVSGPDASKLSGINTPRAWLTYRISPEGRLQRTKGPSPQGGVMGISGGLDSTADIDALTKDIFVEYTRRGFRAVMLDVDHSCDAEALRTLADRLSEKGLALMLPEVLHGGIHGAKAVISSALWSGSFRAMLDSAAARLGAENLCLEINRMCHDFPMPCLSGQGSRLSHSRLAEIKSRYRPTPRLCPEMQCKYFSYASEEGPRFVLFDDLEGVRSKIRCARELGLHGVFVLYSQWQGGARALL